MTEFPLYPIRATCRCGVVFDTVSLKPPDQQEDGYRTCAACLERWVQEQAELTRAHHPKVGPAKPVKLPKVRRPKDDNPWWER